MVKAGAVFRQPCFVECRAIALVQLESVAWIFPPEGNHDAVACHFGDDGGRRDRRRQRVAVDGTALRTAQIEHAGVDDERVDVNVEVENGALHRHPVGWTETNGVDLRHRYDANPDGDRSLLDSLE